jgi:HK97 family phage portal protein
VATLRQLRAGRRTEHRYTVNDYVQWLSSGNLRFPVSMSSDTAPPTQSHAGVYTSNGVVFACMQVRASVFAEVSFRFAAVDNGRVGRLFGTPDLDVLQRPWPNGSTGELAARMIQDVDLWGNFYAVREGSRIHRRDPAHVSIVLSGDPREEEFVDVAAYLYQPGGPGSRAFTYTPEQVCHWSPLPDPAHPYRGMSWLTPVLREVRADNAATNHKAKFFEQGGTPSMVVKFPPDIMDEDAFLEFKRKMDAAHEGGGNAYKTLYLAPGADVEVVGKDFQQLAFDATQGRDEARIASAAGVPAVIVGIKESLQGSSLNTGNYSAARRRFADATMRPLYGSAASALEALVPPPQGRGAAKLWYDDSQVAFFREDRADAAEIQQVKAQTIRALVDAGYQPESVVAAVEAEDVTLLVHSGLFSVQLQAAGAGQPARSRRVEHDPSGRIVRLVEE